MKDFFKTSSFKVLVIAAVVLLGLIIYTASAGSSFLANMLGFVSSPMQGISTNVTDSVKEFIDLDGMSKDELKQLCEQYNTENAKLRGQLVDYQETLQENERLKTQLEIKEEAPDNEMTSASVIGRDPNDMFYGFSIDKGYLAGVSVDDPVITQNGLVGIVTQVYATTSKVTCLLSEDVKVAAMSKELGESGVITSNIQMANSGTLRMDYLTNKTELKAGDLITTSGAGGVYPKDLIIGQVESVEQADYDISKYAVVKPYENLKTVKDVFVITNFPGKDAENPELNYGDESAVSGGEDPEADK